MNMRNRSIRLAALAMAAVLLLSLALPGAALDNSRINCTLSQFLFNS